MKGIQKLLITIGSAVLFYIVLKLLLKNDMLTAILTLSVFLHECGHWIMFRFYGYKAGMLFIPALGALVYPDDKEAFKKLPRLADVAISLAGPVVNIVLAGAGIFYAIYFHAGNIALAFASINASLAVFNLLPVAIFDGGRYARSLFASTNEEQDKILAWILTTVGILIGGVIFFTGKLDFYALLLIYGAQVSSRSDDEAEAYSPRSMTWNQSRTSLVIYLVLFAASWILAQYLPNWRELLK